MAVLLALKTLNDYKEDEQQAAVEHEDNTFDFFHNNSNWKDNWFSMHSSTAMTTIDHASENVDDIFLVATAVATKILSAKKDIRIKYTSKKMPQ